MADQLPMNRCRLVAWIASDACEGLRPIGYCPLSWPASGLGLVEAALLKGELQQKGLEGSEGERVKLPQRVKRLFTGT